MLPYSLWLAPVWCLWSAAGVIVLLTVEHGVNSVQISQLCGVEGHTVSCAAGHLGPLSEGQLDSSGNSWVECTNCAAAHGKVGHLIGCVDEDSQQSVSE